MVFLVPRHADSIIDPHTHSSNQFNIKMSMIDGVTSGMDFEAGALNVAQWFEREAGKRPINYGTCASQELTRGVVHDGPTDAFSPRWMLSFSVSPVVENGLAKWCG